MALSEKIKARLRERRKQNREDAKRAKLGPSQEFCYVDDDGKRQDADLHNEILDEGEADVAEEQSRMVMQRAGLSQDQIELLLKK